MKKKRVTKIDPQEKLSRYLNYQSNQTKNKQRTKVSASLSKLRNERKTALVRKLGLIFVISLIALIMLGYYISPLANVNSVKIIGETDLPVKDVVQTSEIKASDKVIDYLLHQSNIKYKLMRHYPEIKSIQINISNFNQLTLKINEYQTIGYIKKEAGYRKILINGNLGSQLLPWNKISRNQPIFIGYNHEVSLKNNLHLFNSLPKEFRDQIKLLSGKTRRKSQVIFVMKDNNVIIGNIDTLKSKLKYYNDIKDKAGKESLIDLEVGAYSRPLTTNEKRVYGIL
ncbi:MULTISPECIES: cell division protein FtsQ/DivIB [unclassified Lactobacillus]|uniref:cell division protein FtsQ/DivIB n=1 Tax=unclassified Lactobacillus TaxID=2620435 RepID=UPI000EFD2E4D|nr:MULTISPECIES: FtsQ-type POTRA domain-containing protein [unclassified Lactobacillus]RMC25105.1 FtsQ-type POTRA domain-containing protein [Lactobacillus sp. ESL0247]RMC29260.1 FtsQ-type POTRA domain-containing protein [Lactobacillus sp. ESL0246]RMC32280.1 FtsQ-type POTRA domain-containing protein [Lactobacillus sp. ESL0245]